MPAPPRLLACPGRRRLAQAALAACALSVARAGQAQSARTIPEDVALGTLRIGVFPEAVLDGQAIRLGAGARIRDEQNLIRPPAMVEGDRRVAYRRGTMGEVTEVWLLTDAEHRATAARIAAARRAAAQR